MKRVVNYQTARQQPAYYHLIDYPKEVIRCIDSDLDRILFEGILSISLERVRRIAGDWREEMHRKYNYALVLDPNEKDANRTDIKAIAMYSVEGVRGYPTRGFELLGKIFMYSHGSETHVTLSFFDWEDWSEEAREALKGVGDFEMPTIPHAEEIFEDLAGRLRAYERPEDPRLLQAILPPVKAQADGGKVEKLKSKGRYRLSNDEIKFRRGKVKEANAEKKKNPLKRWREIDAEFADQLEISSGSFRHWRHNNY